MLYIHVKSGNLDIFIDLIKSLFSEEENGLITENTDIKCLKEWSSLQNMIVVSEIDKIYEVIVSVEDFKSSSTIKELFEKVLAKQV